MVPRLELCSWQCWAAMSKAWTQLHIRPKRGREMDPQAVAPSSHRAPTMPSVHRLIAPCFLLGGFQFYVEITNYLLPAPPPPPPSCHSEQLCAPKFKVWVSEECPLALQLLASGEGPSAAPSSKALKQAFLCFNPARSLFCSAVLFILHLPCWHGTSELLSQMTFQMFVYK